MVTVLNPTEISNTIASNFQLLGLEPPDIRRNLILNYFNFMETGVGPNWIKGDYNQDDFVNIIDILLVVEGIIELTNPNVIQYWISDLNHDDIINIQDITLMVNIILLN